MLNMTKEQLRGRDENINPPEGEKRCEVTWCYRAGLEARVTRVKVAMADVKERLDRLEQGMEESIEMVSDKLENHQDQTLEAITVASNDLMRENMSFQAKILEALANI